jgi:carboxymethylenebutenolidase
MGTTTTLTAEDGHRFAAYEAVPDGPVAGRVVVLQEAFGVNPHIRSVCDRLAAEGYVAVAPALYDRHEAGIELGYTDADIQQARAIMVEIPWEKALLDVQATRDFIGGKGKVGVTGFCWGGSVTWLAACRGDFDAAVSYYGARAIDFIDETPNCPTMMHFGETDPTIPMDTVHRFMERHPSLPIYVYPAGHGFHCDARPHYQAESAKLAWGRTMEFFARNLAG